MSMMTRDIDALMAYMTERITADKAEVLVVFYNSDTDENIAAPLGSELPDGYTVIGSFYWDDKLGDVTFRAVDLD